MNKNSIGRVIIDLGGEQPGQASLLKLIANVLIMTSMEQVAEVNVFAEKTGLGTHNMNKLMSQMFPNPPHAIYNQIMLSGDYHQKVVRIPRSITLSLNPN